MMGCEGGDLRRRQVVIEIFKFWEEIWISKCLLFISNESVIDSLRKILEVIEWAGGGEDVPLIQTMTFGWWGHILWGYANVMWLRHDLKGDKQSTYHETFRSFWFSIWNHKSVCRYRTRVQRNIGIQGLYPWGTSSTWHNLWHHLWIHLDSGKICHLIYILLLQSILAWHDTNEWEINLSILP